jgi:hypothetical protein
MTRLSLNRTLRRLYLMVGLMLIVSVVAKFADMIPGVRGTDIENALRNVYELLRDMSLLIATAGVAYLTNVFQQRSKFVESLEEEWRGLVATKGALHAYCEKPYPSTDDYIATFGQISQTIDNMRIVYRNAGETNELIGLYPYAPLHDMRRALQTLDPRKNGNITPEQRKLARDAILQSFYALRERFLEELDLATPDHPLLISGAWRLKTPGATRFARIAQEWQRKRQGQAVVPRPEIDELLSRLYQAEEGERNGGAQVAAKDAKRR